VVIFVKTFVDVIGSSLLKEMLFFSNLHSLHPLVRALLNLSLVAFVFGLLIHLTTSKLLTEEQLEDVLSSFLAVWFLARITEVFHLGTLWALKVSYGSSVGCALI